MSAAPLALDWRRPGCGDLCYRYRHDPEAHELYGKVQGVLLATMCPPAKIIRTGPLTVNLESKEVTVNGRMVNLPEREWEVLAHLAVRVGRPCLVDDITAEIWGAWMITGRRYKSGTRSDQRPVVVTIHRLRCRLGEAGYLVRTVNAGANDSSRMLIQETPR